MNLFTVPAHVPFLDAIASEWLACAAHPMEVARGLILLPTRRAARALAEAFLRVSGGQALLMPRITAIGALDETHLALSGALDLPPEVEPMQRLAALTRLILAMGGADGAPRTADQAWRLAEELASLMDEAERAEIDLARALPDAADPSFARHWSQTLSFLRIVTATWPDYLAEQGLMNPAARQVALLDAQAAAWEQCPPAEPVLACGGDGRHQRGRASGADDRPPAERRGRAAGPRFGHAGRRSGRRWRKRTTRPGCAACCMGSVPPARDVRVWPALPQSAVPPERVALLRRVLLPGAALAEWQAQGEADTTGLSLLQTADQQEEAAAIALVLRDALEQSGARAALVTPDRELAVRVSAELLRFGVVADDSAGEALADTPPAVFLRLLARRRRRGAGPGAAAGFAEASAGRCRFGSRRPAEPAHAAWSAPVCAARAPSRG